MPTAKFFDQCPPFPLETPLIPLPKISLKDLESHDKEEAIRLFNSCQEWGFFILDLNGSNEGEALLQSAENMFDLTNETFSLGQSILDSYAYNPPYDLTGYKQKGKLRTDNGKMDCMELYSINQDDILGNCQRRRNVGSIEANRLQIRNFIQQSRTVSEVILAQLDGQLGLQPGTLAALSPLDQPSDSSVRLLLAQPQLNPQTDSITLGGHTDIGTITLLFNVIGGLQILPARSENVMANWRYVKPEVGCAIVNIGDTIVEWTGGLLRSSLHRVVTAPGKQALVPRRSVAYLARAQKNASMRRLRSGLISPLEKDHEETCTVTEWAAWRSQQIIRGELKPQTRGGKTRDECESSPQI